MAERGWQVPAAHVEWSWQTGGVPGQQACPGRPQAPGLPLLLPAPVPVPRLGAPVVVAVPPLRLLQLAKVSASAAASSQWHDLDLKPDSSRR